jgi:hypothetical protein
MWLMSGAWMHVLHVVRIQRVEETRRDVRRVSGS